MMCTAVYLKKYAGVKDKLAFLSPCIGKLDEIADSTTKGLVDYNVTYAKLAEYLVRNNIVLSQYPSTDFDGDMCRIGLTFSRPGGLRENVEHHKQGSDVIEIEDLGYRQFAGQVLEKLDEAEQQTFVFLLNKVTNNITGS